MIRCTHQRRVKRSGFGSFEFMAFYHRNSVQKYEVFFIWQKKSANIALFLPFLGVFFYVVGSTSTHINRRTQARKYIYVRAWRVTPELEQRSPCGGASRHRRAKIDTTSSQPNGRDTPRTDEWRHHQQPAKRTRQERSGRAERRATLRGGRPADERPAGARGHGGRRTRSDRPPVRAATHSFFSWDCFFSSSYWAVVSFFSKVGLLHI